VNKCIECEKETELVWVTREELGEHQKLKERVEGLETQLKTEIEKIGIFGSALENMQLSDCDVPMDVRIKVIDLYYEILKHTEATDD